MSVALSVEWQRLPGGAVSHALLVDGRQKGACGRADERWTEDGADSLPRCRRCVKALAGAFAVQESELSADARAILAYARKWGAPFTRFEITEAAPGAAWDQYPQTVAKFDPIRELVRAGFVEEHDEQPVKSNPRKSYKRWRLTGAKAVLSLAELLDRFAEVVRLADWRDDSDADAQAAEAERDQVRAEILRRFDRDGRWSS